MLPFDESNSLVPGSQNSGQESARDARADDSNQGAANSLSTRDAIGGSICPPRFKFTLPVVVCDRFWFGFEDRVVKPQPACQSTFKRAPDVGLHG